MKYTAYLIQAMSQVVEFEAADDASPEELASMAGDRSDLDPNISNNFDTDGDLKVHFIKDDQDRVIYSETDEKEDPDAVAEH